MHAGRLSVLPINDFDNQARDIVARSRVASDNSDPAGTPENNEGNLVTFVAGAPGIDLGNSFNYGVISYDEVLALHGEGISQRVIANRLGIHRSTVRRFVEAGSFPERADRPSARRTDGFADYLKERWAAGCQNAMQLYGELQARGYSGSYYSVRRQLAPWRSALPPSGEGPVPKPVPAAMGRPSARRVSWLLLLDEADLEPQEQQFRERLQERCPELGSAAKLAREFRTLVREHRESGWDAWLSQACGPESVKELRGFAEGLRTDEAAVRAALRMVVIGAQNGPT